MPGFMLCFVEIQQKLILFLVFPPFTFSILLKQHMSQTTKSSW